MSFRESKRTVDSRNEQAVDNEPVGCAAREAGGIGVRTARERGV